LKTKKRINEFVMDNPHVTQSVTQGNFQNETEHTTALKLSTVASPIQDMGQLLWCPQHEN
jgi:hypothetical protein